MDDDGHFLLPVGTVTLLLADVEGSTRSWELAEEDMAAAMETLSATVDECVGRNHGVRPLEQGEGDSFVAAFARASEAVACALDIERALIEGPLRLRIGLHSGEAQRRTGKTYVGPAVNRTARVRDAGHGGQVLLSHATAELVADRLPEGCSLLDLGRHRLKDLARPEQIVQLVHRDLRREFPPLRTLDTHRHNLPEQRTPLFGRHAETDQICALLAANRLVTLHGAGGCGKTRLGLQVAAHLLDDHTDGVYFVDLSTIRIGVEVTRVVLSALGLEQEPDAALVPHLRDMSVLLVIDNCEHVIEPCAAVVDRILMGTTSCRLLCTSREPLGVTGEVTVRVSTLPVPPAEVAGLEGLAPFPAAELFIDRARRVRSGFDPTQADARAIAEICRRLDGMPLAIELAASRVRAFTAADIARGLSERFRLLTGGSRTALPRQQTLQASVDWSHELLTTDERSVFRRLAVFAGSFDLDAGRSVCAVSGIEPHQVVDLVGLLVDKSLVLSDDRGVESRFRLLETLREYALAKLVESGEADLVRLRHRDHFLSVAERLGPVTVETSMEPSWSELHADYDNLRAAVDFCCDRSDLEELARFCAALYGYLGSLGSLGEPLRWFGDLFRRLDQVSPVAAAGVGWLLRPYADAEMDPPLERALTEFRADGRDSLAARAALGVAGALLAGTPTERAIELVHDALAAARRAGDVMAEAVAHTYLIGPVSWIVPLDFEPHVAALVDLSTHAGVREFCLGHAAGALRSRGGFRRARELVDSIRPDSLQLGSSQAALDLAQCMVMSGELGAGDSFLDVALAYQTALGDHEGRGRVLLSMAIQASTADSDPGRAIDLARSAREELAASGTGNARMITTRLHCLVASWEVAREHLDAARSAVDAAAAMRVLPGAKSWVHVARAAVARGEHDHEMTERWTYEALDVGQRFTIFPSITSALELLAGLSVTIGGHAEAARLLGAAATMRGETGELVRFPPFDRWHGDDAAAARLALGDGAFDEAWAVGAATPWREMVAWALRGRGQRRRPAVGWASLTPTERQVVELVVEGLSNKAVGDRLFISARTVASHLRKIFDKLDVSSRTELAAAHRRAAARAQP